VLKTTPYTSADRQTKDRPQPKRNSCSNLFSAMMDNEAPEAGVVAGVEVRPHKHHSLLEHPFRQWSWEFVGEYSATCAICFLSFPYL